ncbi:biotin/lipoyl-containing protein [Pedobacter sp.]|uniref:biotin/lipoyl-containing protein n=1 Tax=Pedobacter sp. TaxID=1411316 RepID=UPI00396CBFD3
MNQVKVNGNFNYDISINNKEIKVGDQIINIDQMKVNDYITHILHNNKSYTVELIALNKEEKEATIKVNNNIYQVAVKDQYDQLLKQLGLENMTSNKVSQIKAPMPGLVLNVLVQAGQEVKKGDSLLVLEAMKMENMIKSPTDGIIKKIEVKQGDKVEKNVLLISFN